MLSPDGLKEEGNICTESEVEEAKAVLRLVPIWVTSMGYAVVFAQISTFFTKQGATMDRKIFPGFFRELRGHEVVEPEDGNGAVVNGEFVEFVGFKHAGR